jgi:hypothetical protein
MPNRNSRRLISAPVALLCAATLALAQTPDRSPQPSPTPREAKRTFTLQIEVSASDSADKIDGAVVHVESREEGSRFTKDIRTSSRGVVTLSKVPQGRLLIQVVAKQYDTFGDDIVLTQDNQTVRVALKKRGGP